MTDPIPLFPPRTQAGPLSTGGGGGISDGMEARVAALEAHFEHIREDVADIKTDLRGVKDNAERDFRILAGMIIAAAVGLAGIMAAGFGWIH